MCFIPEDGSLNIFDRLRSDIEEKRAQQARAQLGAGKAGGLTPFAVFGPRIGVQNISDVRPGERGRRVSVADLKIGLE